MAMVEEGWISTDRSIHWRRDGTGHRIIVFLHEMGGSLRSFDEIARLLGSESLQLIRIDQRGFGESEKPHSSYPFAALANDVLAVLDGLGIAQPVGVVAVASACAIAADLAIRFPGRVDRLLLCAPALELSETMRTATLERARQMMGGEMAQMAEGALAAMYPAALRGADFNLHRARFLSNDPVAFAHATRAFAESEVPLEQLSARVLLLAGESDIRPVDAVRALLARLPDASMQVVAGAGHMMAQQAPTTVAQRVTDFLAFGER
jgi:3-oxoadipate enol-lactonase